MITLHHLEYSQSFRLLWLMEAMNAPYELKVYERDAKTRLAPDAYKSVAPLGTAPFITDSDRVLGESNAIMDHLMDLHDDGSLRPAAGDPRRMRYLFWFHAVQGSLMPLLLMAVVFDTLKSRTPFPIRGVIKAVLGKAEESFLQPRLSRILTKAEADLGETTWLAGDTLTAADITMSYCFEAMDKRGRFDADYPNIQRWLAQMHADPAFQRAVEKDGRDSIVFTG